MGPRLNLPLSTLAREQRPAAPPFIGALRGVRPRREVRPATGKLFAAVRRVWRSDHTFGQSDEDSFEQFGLDTLASRSSSGGPRRPGGR